MPYIDPEQRPAIDALLQPLIRHLKAAGDDRSVNYAITRLIHGLYGSYRARRATTAAYVTDPDFRPVAYADLSRALGVLAAAQLEFYRREVAVFEDERLDQNGDVA